MTRFRVAVLAALVLVGLVAGCSSGSGSGSGTQKGLSDLNNSTKYDGFGLIPPMPRPNFTLTDTAGTKFAFGHETAGHPTLLYFGYTRCPDQCPETMADVRLALAKVPASTASKTDVVFVSTDVKHDTGPVIARWLGNFSHGSAAHWVGLRGTKAQIDAAQAAAHVSVATDGGQTHSTELLLFGTDDYAHVTYASTNGEQKQIAHDLPLVAGSAS